MGILDSIKENIYYIIKDFLRSIEEELSRTFMKSIHKIKRQIIKQLMALSVIIISIGLLSISAIFFLIEYLHLSKTLSFLIIGIIILIIGLLIKLTN